MQRIQQSEALVYTVAFGAGTNQPAIRKQLEEYAKASGGRVFFPCSIEQLDEAFSEMLSELSSQYLRSYAPAAEQTSGLRRLEVALVTRRGRVRARVGYMAGKFLDARSPPYRECEQNGEGDCVMLTLRSIACGFSLAIASCLLPAALSAAAEEAPALTMRVTSHFGFGTLLLPVNFPKAYLSVSVGIDLPADSGVAGGLALRVGLPAGGQMGTSVSAPPGWTCAPSVLGATDPVLCTSTDAFGTPARLTFRFSTGAAFGCPHYCTFEATLARNAAGAPTLARATATPGAGEPSLRWITPATGNVEGGFAATITGDAIGSPAAVMVGGTLVPVGVTDGARVTVAMPPGTPGQVEVVVVTAGGKVLSLPGGFTYVGGPADVDLDGLVDDWERRFGLRVDAEASSAHGGGGDPDGDGATNLAEQAARTHPLGAHTLYFAEGAVTNTLDFTAATVTPFFDTAFALLNPSETQAVANFRFQRFDGATVSLPLSVPARSRRTVNVRTDVPSLLARRSLRRSGGPLLTEEFAEFSTIVEADQRLVVDRTMRWDREGYGSHAEAGIGAPATTWYLAEGATHSGFDLFYLLQNPGTTAATVYVRYLLPAPAAPIVKSYELAPSSRYTIWVDSDDPRLSSTDVSAHITADAPIIVERAMYRSKNEVMFGAGHNSAGVTAARPRWLFAEGATGPYFDTFLLIANPNTEAADVRATYLLPTGQTVVKTYSIAPQSRYSIWVDGEDPLLGDTAVSAVVEATNGVGIIAERAMWWPGDSNTWHEGHGSPGAAETGTTWAMAEGNALGPDQQTYILVANTSSFPADVRATLLFEDGTTAVRTFAVPAESRFNIAVPAEFFPEALDRRFGAVVESLGDTPAQIVVERAMYSNAAGVAWAAGTNALATKLR